VNETVGVEASKKITTTAEIYNQAVLMTKN
jgi:hypothetical protein